MFLDLITVKVSHTIGGKCPRAVQRQLRDGGLVCITSSKFNFHPVDMDNNNVVSEWSETPAMFLTSVLCEIKYKHREDYAYRENSMSQETSKGLTGGINSVNLTLNR